MSYDKSLIINTRQYGLFSSIFQIIDNLKYCEINNYKPILNIGNKFLYQNNTKNIWETYFEPINDSIIEGDSVEVSTLTNKANFFLDDYLMMRPSADNYELKLWNLLSTSTQLQEHRNEIKNMFDKYIKPIKTIKEEIETFHKTDNFLSVHIRSTDYCFTDINLFKDRIKEILSRNNYQSIFVASDSLQGITEIVNSFPITNYYKTNLRCPTLDHPHPLCHIVQEDDKIKHGRDALIEAFLLSKGKEIICINSNVAAAACYLNPEIKINLIQRRPEGG